MKEKETLLKVRNLNKVFKNKSLVVKAINNVSFEVKKGEVVGLIGESGSGKTTIGRTVIGLHESTSGIMELEGQDITNYSIRKVRKNVVNNIQMIFQDPYSSLNGQKNVLSIVSEPIISNKLWKKDVKSTLENRELILKYYKFSLIAWFNSKYNDYRIYANKQAMNFSKKLNKSLLKFKIDPKETKEINYNALSSLFYRERHIVNLRILERLVETEEKLFDKWQTFNENIINLKGIPYDEKALIKIEKEIKETKLLIKFSKEALEIKEDFAKLHEEMEEVKSNHEIAIKRAKNNYKKIVGFLKDELKIQITEKKLSETQELYEFYDKKTKDVSQKITFLQKLWKESVEKIWLDMEETSNFFNEQFGKKTTNKKFTDLFKASNEKTLSSFNKKETSLKNKEVKLAKKLKTELAGKRDQDIVKYKELYEEKMAKHKEATSVFEEETKTFLEKFNVEQDEKLEKANDEIDQNIDDYKKYKFENKKIFNNVLENLKKEFPKDKFSDKTMKLAIKKEEEKNQALEIELKNVQKNIEIVKKLFNIKKSYFPLGKSLKKLIIRNKVFDALRHSGLKTSYAYRYPHEFSGGMRQRVGIARAIIGKPKLIIADEPIAALDLSIQAQVVNMLLDQRDRLDLAMIFIAHDLSMVRFNSDRVLIMHLGRIVEYGDTEKIFKKPVHPYTINLMESMPTIKKAKEKIEVFEFKSKYLESYSPTNQPKYFEVRPGHFVLATNSQFKKWN